MTPSERTEAAAASLGVVTLGGRAYLVSPVTHRDMGTIHARLRAELVRPDALAARLAALPLECREAASSIPTGGMELTAAAAGDLLGRPDLAAFVAWVLVRREQPGATLERIRQGVPDEPAAVRVLADLYDASGLAMLGDGWAAALVAWGSQDLARDLADLLKKAEGTWTAEQAVTTPLAQLAALAAPPPQSPAEVLRRVNESRAGKGLPPLKGLPLLGRIMSEG